MSFHLLVITIQQDFGKINPLINKNSLLMHKNQYNMHNYAKYSNKIAIYALLREKTGI